MSDFVTHLLGSCVVIVLGLLINYLIFIMGSARFRMYINEVLVKSVGTYDEEYQNYKKWKKLKKEADKAIEDIIQEKA